MTFITFYNSNTLTVGGGGHAVSKRSGTNGADYYLQGYAGGGCVCCL
ncbi:TonB-dependent siderophore receptor [Klebsiella pneumoniae]|nr:TonB-dependent siderophore receptor [Klebsiella pneumoniae]